MREGRSGYGKTGSAVVTRRENLRRPIRYSRVPSLRMLTECQCITPSIDRHRFGARCRQKQSLVRADGICPYSFPSIPLSEYETREARKLTRRKKATPCVQNPPAATRSQPRRGFPCQPGVSTPGIERTASTAGSQNARTTRTLRSTSNHPKPHPGLLSLATNHRPHRERMQSAWLRRQQQRTGPAI